MPRQLILPRLEILRRKAIAAKAKAFMESRKNPTVHTSG